jgi:GNAT superfamily N-acetyltransferase
MNQRDLIQRVDRVESESFITLYSAAREWGTGWHTEDGVTSVWAGRDDDPSFSCVLNLAESSRREETLLTLESVARDRGAQVFGVDTHPDLDDWASDERLRTLGFQPDSEECIWALDLTRSPHTVEIPADVTIREATEADQETFASVLNIGWGLERDAARGYVFAAGIGLENWVQYIAEIDGRPAGIAVLFIHDQVADCFLSATVAELRGRGVQTALIERRLSDGQERGCTLATSQTVVHNASPRNMARRGFQPLYRRWIYGKSLHSRDASSIQD